MYNISESVCKMFFILLGLAFLAVTTSAQGGVFKSKEETWSRVKQCKELIVQYILTLEKPVFNPEVVRNCIEFLRNIEYTENSVEVVSKKAFTKQETILTTKSLPEEVSHPSKQDPRSPGETKKDPLATPGNEKLLHQQEYTHLNVDSNITSSEDDDLVDIYPENIVQEWPAVEIVRRKRGNSGVEEIMNKENQQKLIGAPPKHSKSVSVNFSDISNDISQLTDKTTKESLWTSGNGKLSNELEDTNLNEDSNLTPPKDDELVDIYPENIVQEWPAVEIFRRRRGIDRDEETPKNQQKATNIKTKNKKDTSSGDYAGRPSWEKHRLQDDLDLDNRGRNRPQTILQLIKYKFEIFLSWLRAKLRLGPQVKLI